jgi:hypothetical protein
VLQVLAVVVLVVWAADELPTPSGGSSAFAALLATIANLCLPLTDPGSGLASVLVLVLGLPAIDHAAMRSAIGRIVVS